MATTAGPRTRQERHPYSSFYPYPNASVTYEIALKYAITINSIDRQDKIDSSALRDWLMRPKRLNTLVDLAVALGGYNPSDWTGVNCWFQNKRNWPRADEQSRINKAAFAIMTLVMGILGHVGSTEEEMLLFRYTKDLVIGIAHKFVEMFYHLQNCVVGEQNSSY